jgi:hypothetical protein
MRSQGKPPDSMSQANVQMECLTFRLCEAWSRHFSAALKNHLIFSSYFSNRFQMDFQILNFGGLVPIKG